jgi:SAM-dependent methyltransferase
MTASDLSPGAVARARVEAQARALEITFAVADLRRLSHVFSRTFAAVLACDNAIPHLLSDDDIRLAFAECRGLLPPGGLFALSVRDYAAIERRTPDLHSYGTRTVGDFTYVAEQIWRWDGDQYDLTLRLSEHRGADQSVIHEFHSRYYAVSVAALEQLLREAGFEFIVRRDEYFFQPLLIAINPPVR